MRVAPIQYNAEPSKPQNGGPDRLPLSPGAVGNICAPLLVDASAYSEPERFPCYWTGRLIHHLSAECRPDNRWLWTFDRDILGYIARLPGGGTFVEHFSREHTLNYNDLDGLPVLRIARRILRLMWEADWEQCLECIDPDFYKRTESLSGTEYDHLRLTSFAWILRRPHLAVEAIEQDQKMDATFWGPEWPDPEPLPDGLPGVPTFDTALLPDSLRDWITDTAERLQCPPDYLAAACIVALSAVVGRQITIRPQEQDDWTVVPNLWGAVIGPPGVLKTPALAEALKPLEALEDAARERFDRDQAAYEAKLQVAKQAEKKADRDIKKALEADDEKGAEEIASRAKRKRPQPPTRQRYLTQDTTVEKLGELLAGNPNGILVYRDELVGWLRSLDKQGYESARAFYLEAWNGTGRFTFDRIGRGTVEIEATTVSILGGIQPGPLTAYLSGALNGGSGDDGLLQRLQVTVWPDPPKSWKAIDRKPNIEARQKAYEVFQLLSNLHQVEAQRDIGSPLPFLRFDPQAQAAFKDWRQQLEQRLRAGDMAPVFEAVLAKQRSLLPSLALLIHLADRPQGGAVSHAAVQKAIGWVQYLEDHARRLYAPALDPETTAARALGERIQAGDLGQVFRERDVYKNCWQGLDRESTRRAVTWLVEAGWLKQEWVKTGGRPTVYYHVNPAVLK